MDTTLMWSQQIALQRDWKQQASLSPKVKKKKIGKLTDFQMIYFYCESIQTQHFKTS